jgi:glucan-binding YG repeat protein
MRKQTKLVAVLSAAALLAFGASMTSFAAGWEKDEAGIWHYYDSDDELVTGEWKKDGGKWFYLDDDGDMLTDSWVDDEYYVGSDGAMYVNQWYKGFADDEEQDDPEDDGEHWYYFNSKGKKTEGKKKINGKTYYFTPEGQMRWGWYQDNSGSEPAVYYLGGEDEGWRAEDQWLWLEKSPVSNEEEDDEFNQVVLGCSSEDNCDDEGWYRFQSSGKMYYGSKKKKINGRWFMFNDHGQMLYEWIAGTEVSRGSNAQLDGKTLATVGEKKTGVELDKNGKPKNATIGQMFYYLPNGSDSVDGSRANGWYYLDGSESVGTDTDTDWYYIKNGEAKTADINKDGLGIMDGDDEVFTARIKVDGKYFAFNEKGQMQTGLQLIGTADSESGEVKSADIYYFDENGYQKTGKVANVEEGDDDTYTYYFTTKNAGNGKGYTGEKDGYLYWNGKRCEADDDYKIYYVDNTYWLVNTKGKLQKANKKYNVERANDSTAEDLRFSISKKYHVEKITETNGYTVTLDGLAEIPHIQIEDSWVIPTKAKGGEKVLNGEAIPDTEFFTKAQWESALKSSKAADEDDAEEE